MTNNEMQRTMKKTHIGLPKTWNLGEDEGNTVMITHYHILKACFILTNVSKLTLINIGLGNDLPSNVLCRLLRTARC